MTAKKASWQAREAWRQQGVDHSRRERLFRQFVVGAEFRFEPAKGLHPRTGETCIVVRPPRNDVAHPSLRVRWADGTEEAVAPSQLHRLTALTDTPYHDRPAVPPIVEAARRRPAWGRLLTRLEEVWEAERQIRAGEHLLNSDLDEDVPAPASSSSHEALEADVRHRLAQLVGTLAPRGSSPTERQVFAEQLRAAAEQDAQERRAARPGRAGQPAPLPYVAPPVPTDVPLTPEVLDQRGRRMHNVLARCIHRRYFLSDALPRERGPKVHRAVRHAIRDAGQSEDISIEQPAPREPRPSELHREATDAYKGMVDSALEVCNLFMTGQDAEAHALLERHREHRHTYVQAERAKESLRPQFYTGRYFHGDILSVRDEHFDEEAQAYDGMTQYYTRLVIVYGEDGHSVVVANAAELEARVGVRAGPQGWRDLCRWIEDTSDRVNGKKQGRRQADDDHLVYRKQEESLVLRENVRQKYPYLTDALECVRLSLSAEFSDVKDEEIPPHQPVRGFHPPKRPEIAR